MGLFDACLKQNGNKEENTYKNENKVTDERYEQEKEEELERSIAAIMKNGQEKEEELDRILNKIAGLGNKGEWDEEFEQFCNEAQQGKGSNNFLSLN